MRIVRFIGVAVILCAGIVGQGDAQKQDSSLAFLHKQRALHHSMLDTFAECAKQTPQDGIIKCAVFQEQIRQAELAIFLSPELAATLSKKKLSADDIEDIKFAIATHLLNAYDYGKSKQ